MKRLVFGPFCAALLLGCGGGGGSDDRRPNVAPTVEAEKTVSIDANTSSSTTVTVSDDRTEADGLLVQLSSDNIVLFPEGALSVSDSGTARTITLSPSIDNVGTGVVTVTVSDAVGLASSAEIEVQVLSIVRNATTFSRDLATVDANGAPSFVNAVQFVDDAADDSFDDLLNQ